MVLKEVSHQAESLLHNLELEQEKEVANNIILAILLLRLVCVYNNCLYTMSKFRFLQ